MSRRSRFRRELVKDGKKDHEEIDAFGHSLGHRLAVFKTCPDPELEQQFNLARSRPLFIGACSLCTTFSSATFLPESIFNFAAMQDSLEATLKASSPLQVIDFQKAFLDNHYVKELSKAAADGEEEFSTEYFIARQSIRQDEDNPGSLLQRLKFWWRQKVLRWLYPAGVLYHPGQLEVLERCAKSKAPFLFLPVHKSPLDAVLVNMVLSQSRSRHDLKTFVASRPEEMPMSPGFELLTDYWHLDSAWAVQQATVSNIFAQKRHILAFLEPFLCSEGRPIMDLDTNIIDHALQTIYDQAVSDIQIVPVGLSFQDPKASLQKWPTNFFQYIRGLQTKLKPKPFRVTEKEAVVDLRP